MAIPTVVQLKGMSEASGERFNYTGKHRYVLTLPVAGGRAVFASAAATVPVLDILRDACWRYHFDVYAYCFLPARLMLIVRGREDLSQLKEFLRAFRQSSNDRMMGELGRVLWSKKYLERVLRKTELTADAARQLFTLPVREGLVASAAEYPLQGSFVEEIRRFVAPPRHRRFPPGRTRGSSPSRPRRGRAPGR
jgi:REP element-mobilizing transposase RayT